MLANSAKLKYIVVMILFVYCVTKDNLYKFFGWFLSIIIFSVQSVYMYLECTYFAACYYGHRNHDYNYYNYIPSPN